MDYDICIIGGGPAGLTAALYAARYGLKVVVIAKDFGMAGSAITIENWPSIKSISGLDLVKKMTEQVKEFDVEVKTTEILEFNKDSVKTRDDEIINAKKFIIATGTEHKELGVPGEKELRGRGVCYCAVCDAMFFKDKTVGVIGGSDAAATSALLLAEQSSKVYIIYRRDKLRAEQAWINKLEKNPKIEIIYNTNVVKINGENKLESVEFDNEKDNSKILELQGLFIEIGHMPLTELTKNIGLELDKEGCIIVNESQKTNVNNFFAAGDVTNGSNGLRQIITACAEGAVAATTAFHEIREEE